MSINRNVNNNNRKKCYSCDEKENHHDKIHRCKGCVCDQLRRLQTQTEVDLFLFSGQIIEDVVFITFDQNNCCAFLRCFTSVASRKPSELTMELLIEMKGLFKTTENDPNGFKKMLYFHKTNFSPYSDLPE